MSLITFDTLQYAKALEAKGFTVEQAEALAEQNKIVFNEFAENQLATKADLFKAKEELKDDTQAIKHELAQINADLLILKWGVGLVVGISVTVAIKYLFGL
ncbi:CCDC90 family protein [Thiomicrospira microaerophila]|uniref:DUF1640 domain-containing protein n=1 Tax=Thiomicrospira microaerophila TaxID=406020 RepID=UPI0005CA23EC|nr:DUF1640 domain-containing protein [Thiomicrospira microaerophila]